LVESGVVDFESGGRFTTSDLLEEVIDDLEE